MPVIESRDPVKGAIGIYPPPATALRVEDIYREIQIPSENPRDLGLPYIAINMVSSLDGKTAVNGTANSIGGPADRRVMRNLRSRFDAVLRGAGTLRADKISLGVTDDLARVRLSENRDAQPLELIVSSDGTRLPLDTNLLDITPGRVAILIPSPSGSAPVLHEDVYTIQMPTTPDGVVDLVPALKTLKRDHGVHSLLLEGGPTLNYSFVSLNIVNELFLTLAPKLLDGPSDNPITLMNGIEPPLRPHETLQLISTHVSGDELFLRYIFNRSVASGTNPVSFR